MGARAAQTPLLAFTDDDMEADREWLASLYRALTQAGSRAAVTGRVVSGAPERAGAFVAATVDRSTPAVYSGRLGVDVLAGGNMAMHRDAFLRLGGFDERLGPGTAFPAAEDNDLGFRILRAGLPIVYVPDAVLTHRAWRGADDYIGLRYAYGLGKGGFYLKHLHLSDWHTAGRLARDLLQRGRRTVRFAREPRRAVGEIAYAVGVLSGACEWLVRQPSVPWPEERAGHDV
jgi:GT2 family glycosyltransferase